MLKEASFLYLEKILLNYESAITIGIKRDRNSCLMNQIYKKYVAYLIRMNMFYAQSYQQ